MSEAVPNYAGEIPLPTPEETRTLAQMITDLEDAEIAVEVAEAELKARKITVLELKRSTIPALMASMHMEKFSNGELSVTVKKGIFSSVTAERAAAVHKWLEENGHGGLIKREISVPFAMGQDEQAAELRMLLDNKYPGNVKQEEWVETNSLNAFLRKQLEAEVEIPLELFGAQEYREAKVERKKK